MLGLSQYINFGGSRSCMFVVPWPKFCCWEVPINIIIVGLNINIMNKIMKQRWKMEAIQTCEVMVYTKIFLKFPHKFWPCGPGKEFFMYAHERRGYYTFWQVCLYIYCSFLSFFFLSFLLFPANIEMSFVQCRLLLHQLNGF